MTQTKPKPATAAPLLTIKAAMERLGVGRTTLYAMIDTGLLERRYLPAPPNKDGTPREKWPRVTLVSVERYERGEAVPSKRPAGLVKPRPRPADPTKRGIHLPASMKQFRSPLDRASSSS
jgi:hypothetical protein